MSDQEQPGCVANAIGLVIALVLVGGGLYWCSMPPATPPPTAEDQAQLDRLLADLVEPCTSRAYFTRILGRWYLTLGEAHMDIHQALPDHRGRIVQTVEALGGGDDVALIEVLVAVGDCPP